MASLYFYMTNFKKKLCWLYEDQNRDLCHWNTRFDYSALVERRFRIKVFKKNSLQLFVLRIVVFFYMILYTHDVHYETYKIEKQ